MNNTWQRTGSATLFWLLVCCVQQCVTDGGCCLIMQYEYLWADGVKYKKPVRLSAPEYVDKLFDWIEDQVRQSRDVDRPQRASQPVAKQVASFSMQSYSRGSNWNQRV
eukprot:GHRR01023586.1.p3 GENE.GHRR01023586.1~~GHRR01023586.1.p3  ORF type:complete len:108 (+),score=22.27 GHRR01023586.1:439-762(+)